MRRTPAGAGPQWARAEAKWYLSFDCATKTFAWSLVRLDLAALGRLQRRLAAVKELGRRAAAAVAAAECALAAALEAPAPEAEVGRVHTTAQALEAEVGRALAAARTLEAEAGRAVTLADGAVVDLVPGVQDKEIPTVTRLRAVARYIATVARPALERHAAGAPRRVVIEYQMGQNSPARAVSAALVALFADEDVTLVGPGLKTTVHVCEEGRYARFAERYKNSYDANKAHAKYNFARLEKTFGSGIGPSTAALRGHIADSVMQVLGLLVNGPDEAESASYY